MMGREFIIGDVTDVVDGETIHMTVDRTAGGKTYRCVAMDICDPNVGRNGKVYRHRVPFLYAEPTGPWPAFASNDWTRLLGRYNISYSIVRSDHA